MPPDEERTRIRDAMDRLLEGRPIRSNGALTVVCLATEASVKRHLLTHRHVDLREEFYARVKAQGWVPDSEVKLRARVAELELTLRQARDRAIAAESEVALLRRMNNVLAVDKDQIQAALEARGSEPITVLRRR
jgi:uncharacterized tellurite resistance protein B-like protein